MSIVSSPAYNSSASYKGIKGNNPKGPLSDEQLRTMPAPAHVRFLEWELASPKERRALLKQSSSQNEEDADTPTPYNPANALESPPQEAYPKQNSAPRLTPGIGDIAVDANNLRAEDLSSNIRIGLPNASSNGATLSTAGLMVRPTDDTYAITEDLRIRLNPGDTHGTFEQRVNGEWESTGITTDVTIYEASGAMSFKGVSESEAEQLLESNLFGRLDTDDNNQLSTQELKDGQAANLVGYKGHVLTGQEWHTANEDLFGGEPISRETFEQQREVFTPASKDAFEAHNRFIQIDTDGDGQLSIEEIKTAQASNLLGFKGAVVPDAIWDSVGAQLAEKNIVITQEYFSQNPGMFKAAPQECF